MTAFVARRALWLTTMTFVCALALFIVTLINLYWQWSQGHDLVASAMFAFVACYYAFLTLSQFRDRGPQLAIGTEGLSLPSASADPIPWTRVLHLRVTRRMIPMRGGQVDLQVDPEIFLKLKFGQRWLGDFVVKGRGVPNTVAVITHGMDRNVAEIEAALKEFWPPRAA